MFLAGPERWVSMEQELLITTRKKLVELLMEEKQDPEKSKTKLNLAR
jgi:hypothetical protein